MSRFQAPDCVLLGQPLEHSGAGPARAATMTVGWGYEPLRFSRGLPMAGFAARKDRSTASLIPGPEAIAVALGDEVIVAADVIGVDPQLADTIAEAAQLPNPVILTATHTHSGPGITPGRLGDFSQEARAVVVNAAATAARRALDSAGSCTVEWLEPQVTGLAHDRRRRKVAWDAHLRALRWKSGGYVTGYLVSYPCHPSIIGPANSHLSPDYPGYLRTRIQEATGCPVIFLTGAAGNVNAGYPERSSGQRYHDLGRTPSDADLFGTTLAETLLAGRWQPVDLSSGISVSRTEVDACLVPIDIENTTVLREQWERQLRSAEGESRGILQRWISWAKKPESGRQCRYRLPVARMRLGDVSLAFLPGEPFLAADLELNSAPGSRAIVGGYYRDTPGYLPDAAQYLLGGYEVTDAHRYYGMPAPFARGTLEALIAAVRGLR
ncbi:hypothetical protein [Brooklawnia sp.]|uniref:hypothetical protein n=1 Tax=Brooklawnia sp. TaxID=2699740 RepID=UPI00312030DF